MSSVIRGSDNFDSAPRLLQTVETTVGAQFVDITGLDLNTHKSYRIECELTENNVANTAIHLFVNGDTTLANYYSQYNFASGAAVASNRTNAPECGSVDLNQVAAATITVYTVNGYIMWTTLVTRTVGGAHANVFYSGSKNSPVTNLTSIRLHYTAGRMGINTRFRVYRGNV